MNLIIKFSYDNKNKIKIFKVPLIVTSSIAESELARRTTPLKSSVFNDSKGVFDFFFENYNQ